MAVVVLVPVQGDVAGVQAVTTSFTTNRPPGTELCLLLTEGDTATIQAAFTAAGYHTGSGIHTVIRKAADASTAAAKTSTATTSMSSSTIVQADTAIRFTGAAIDTSKSTVRIGSVTYPVVQAV